MTALSLAGAVTLSSFTPRAAAAVAPAGRLTVRGTTTPAIAHAQRVRLTPPSQPLSLQFGLPVRNAAELESRVQGLSDPDSLFYRQFMTPPEITAAYGPTTPQLNAVETYIRSSGMSITAVSAARDYVDVKTTVAQAERALGVRFWQWRDSLTGREFFSNEADPALPPAVAPLITSISGLDDYVVPQAPPARSGIQALRGAATRHLLPERAIPQAVTCTKSSGGPPSGPCALPQGPGNLGYIPTQLQSAYFVDTLSASGLCGTQQRCDGAGQSIGILQDGLTNDPGSELQFDSQYGLSPPATAALCTPTASQCPLPYTADGTSTEADLDVQVAHAMAPGAQVIVYETPQSNPYNFAQDTQDLLNLLYATGTTHVNSYSYGQCETDFPPQTLNALHSTLNMLQVARKVLFAASGDAGRMCNSIGPGGVVTYRQGVLTPASDPDVTAVGGTNLFLNSDNSYAFEYAWSESGGGASAMFARPPWQAGPGVPAGTARLVPDVSADAYSSNCDGHDYDLFTCPAAGGSLGYSILTYDSHGQQGWIAAGGTSAATPLWAAIGALYNQYATLQQQPLLDNNVNKFLYILASHNHYYGPLVDVTYNPSYTSDLLGIAGRGWDYPTGLGSPIAYNLIRDMALLSVSPSAAPAGTAVTVSAARFFPGETVTAKESRTRTTLCTGTAASDGTFTCHATIPTSAPAGVNMLTATGARSRENAIAQFMVIGPIRTFTGASISSPNGIAAGADGALWFTNDGNNSIGRISVSGTVTSYTGTGISSPRAITAGPDGALWFTNYGNDSVGRISTVGTVTNYTGAGISQPLGIAAGPDGALWFTNYRNSSIGRISITGTVTNYSGAGVMCCADQIAAGPDGAMWFTEDVSSIGRISMGGIITSTTLSFRSQPRGIAAGPDGALWFTSDVAEGIGRMSISGILTDYFTDSGISYPGLITAGPDGALWFTNEGNNSIGRITSGGTLTYYTGTGSEPVGIAAGPDGALWFTNYGNSSIGRIN